MYQYYHVHDKSQSYNASALKVIEQVHKQRQQKERK